jgi:hypothetical protein
MEIYFFALIDTLDEASRQLRSFEKCPYYKAAKA